MENQTQPICLIEKKISREQWYSSFREGIDGCHDEIRWQHAYNPVFQWIDELNNIRVYFMGWDRLGGTERGLYIPVHVAIVDWGDKTFRFYSNIFKMPEMHRKYGEPQDTCWMVFRIELVAGWSDDHSHDIDIAKKMITEIVTNIKHKTTLPHIVKAEVRFVQHRFEERPIELVGE